MSQGKMRIGVIGASSGAERWGYRSHIPAISALPEAELTAVCTGHEETAREAQRRTGARLAFWDYHELVHSDEIDLISMPVRIPLHFPIAMAALKAGKHVYCEWPLAMNSKEASQMAALAKREGLYNAVGTQGRFTPAVMYAKHLIEEGYVGRPLLFNLTQFLATSIESRQSDRRLSLNADQGGGALNIAAGHSIDTLIFTLGAVRAVTGHTDTLIDETKFMDTMETVAITATDTVTLMARLESGVLGSIHVSNVCRSGSGFRLEVYGTEGRIMIQAPRWIQYSQARIHGARREREFQELEIPRRFIEVNEISVLDQAFQVAQLYRRLIESIQGRTPFSPSFQDAVKLHETLEAIKRSNDSGGWEEIPQE